MRDTVRYPDDLTSEQRDRMCPSCRIRYQLRPIVPGGIHQSWQVSAGLFRWIENAARIFDAETDAADCWSASDFIEWIKPDVVGEPRYEALRQLMKDRTSEGESARRRDKLLAEDAA